MFHIYKLITLKFIVLYRVFKIYKLYKQQKIARENWGKTLWSNLNPHLLTEGIESYMKEYRKVPKWVSKKNKSGKNTQKN